MSESELNATEWLILRAIREMLTGHAEHYPNQGVDVSIWVKSDNHEGASKYCLGMGWLGLEKEYGKKAG